MNHNDTVSALPVGTNLSRFIQALGQARGAFTIAADIAEAKWKNSPAVLLTLRALAQPMFQKAAVGPMTTITASALMTYGIAAELITLLRGASILSRIAGLMRHTPFRVKIAREVSSTTAEWVGESGAKPLSSAVLDSISMESYKSISMTVLTAELIKFSSPSAESTIRQSLVRSISAHLDSAFLDPTSNAIPTVRPSSITNGATAHISTGPSAAQVHSDLSSMMGLLESWTSPAWILNTSTAAYLASLVNTAGQPAFASVSAAGGSIFGIPAYVSSTVPAVITLLDIADQIIADDGAVDLMLAEHASILLDSNPQASPATTELVSLWQRDLVGVLAEREISWLRGHDSSVIFMSVGY